MPWASVENVDQLLGQASRFRSFHAANLRATPLKQYIVQEEQIERSQLGVRGLIAYHLRPPFPGSNDRWKSVSMGQHNRHQRIADDVRSRSTEQSFPQPRAAEPTHYEKVAVDI